MPLSLYPRGKEPRYPLDRRLGGPLIPSGRCVDNNWLLRAESLLRSWQWLCKSKYCPPSTESICSVSCSQDPVAESCLFPDKFSPHPLSVRPILILPYHRQLGLRSCLFPCCFYAIILFAVRDAWRLPVSRVSACVLLHSQNWINPIQGLPLPEGLAGIAWEPSKRSLFK
jgi:hypothetical protein